jgi:hypothetical protein
MTFRGAETRPYQRRSLRPAGVLVAVLASVVALTWVVVLGTSSDGTGGSVCPPSPTLLAGPVQPATALDQTPPAPLQLVRIRVLNGGGQRGQANLVASQLGELGFTEAADPTNDPLYPQGELSCRGNIRYGAAGAASARTVSLVLPCLPLVRDGRTDETVDVAVGTLFGDVHPAKAAKDVLDQLSGPGGQTTEGGSPSIDHDLLTKAREVRC